MSSDRTVKAILKADVSSLVAGMKQAQKATKDFAADAKTSAGKNSAAWESTGKGMMLAGGVIAAGLTVAVKSFADFDAAMSQAQAGTGATGAALGALRAAAIDAGAKTQFSATEAAQAITAMGKAGVSTKDILGGGLAGALSLAAAGQLDVAQASEIAATAMNQFGLEGKDIPHIADLLAAGAGKAMGSVQDLAGALKYVGPTARGMGVSIEETTGVLAMFAQKGILGEQAGTSMRSMLLTLTSPSAIVAKRMEDLGINVYDASGKFVGLQGAAGELQAKLGPLDDATRNAALGQIFGNEAVGAARILYEGGAPAVAKWTAGVNDAGFAARQAAMLTDNLKGDIERLGGSLSSVLIQSGSGANGMLRTMTQELQGALDLYGSLPKPVQQAATVLGSVAGATLLVGGAMVTLVPKAIAANASLASMGRTGALLSRGMSGTASILKGPFGIALAAGVIGLGYFANQAAESKGRVDEMATSLDQQTGAVTENTRAWVNKNLSDSGALAEANRLGISVGDVTDAVLGNSAALVRVTTAVDAYDASLPKNRQGMLQSATTHHLLSNAISGGNDELNKGIEKTKLLAEANDAGGAAAGGAVAPVDVLANAQTDLAAETQKAKAAIDAEVQALQDSGLVVLSTRAATRDFAQAQRDATAALKENGKGLKDGTVKGDANAATLDKMASSALGLADSIFKETGSEDKMRGSLIESRAALVKTYLQFDNNRGRANAYADSILKIPAHKKTQVELDAAKLAKANADLAALKRKITGLPNGVVKVSTLGYAQTYQYLMTLQAAMRGINNTPVRIATGAGGRGGTTLAGGGLLDGPGTTTSDSIPLWGSTGEYMVKAAAVSKYGVAHFDNLNSMRFASGGYTGPRTSSAPAGSTSDLAPRTDGATSADIKALGDRVGTELQRQARTIQTMQRQMTGMR